jgi:hypothetical protein
MFIRLKHLFFFAFMESGDATRAFASNYLNDGSHR